MAKSRGDRADGIEPELFVDSRNPANHLQWRGQDQVFVPLVNTLPPDEAFSPMARLKLAQKGNARYSDQLTGAQNRHGIHAYFRALAGMQSRNSAAPVHVGMLALDLIGLKAWNDDFLPQQTMGDVILRETAQTLMQSINTLGWTGTSLFRPGGDEFLIIGDRSFLPSRDASLSLLAAEFDRRLPENIDRALATLVETRGIELSLERSVAFRFGVASATYDSGIPSALMANELEKQWDEANTQTAAAKLKLPERRDLDSRDLDIPVFVGHGHRELDIRSPFRTEKGEVIVGSEDDLVRSVRVDESALRTPETTNRLWTEAAIRGHQITEGPMERTAVEPPSRGLGWF